MTTRGVLVPVSAAAVREAEGNFEEVSRFNRRGLFVGGCPKSGTTLLLALLDGHPELVVLPEETHYFEEGWKYQALDGFPARLRHLLRNTEMRRLDPAYSETSSDACGNDARVYPGFDYPRFVQLAEEFASQPGINDSRLLSETIRAFVITMGCHWRDCVRWVEKTPSNVPHADELFRLFPDARLIQVVRDPRAVFASRKRRLLRRYGCHTKAHRLVREWNESSRQITRLRQRTESYRVIRYEDLVQNSRAVLEEVCQFVGIKFLPSLLQPTLAGTPWRGNSAYYRALSGIDTHPVDQWKSELTEDEIWWVELHCREGMKIAGYPLQTDGGFSFTRWAKRLAGESLGGFLRARKSSLCQMAGLLEDCKYEQTPEALPMECGPAVRVQSS